MRIHEFATPDEQLQLWRMVSDAVWAAIDSQRQQLPIIARAKCSCTCIIKSQRNTVICYIAQRKQKIHTRFPI